MPVFYVDLDRTVFRTERVKELFAAIERLYPDNRAVKDGYKKRATYYVFAHKEEGDTTTYYHDIVAWLRDAGLDYREVFARLHNSFNDGRFEYPGAARFIHQLRSMGTVKVLTYGEDIYQRFKASLCPSLQGVEIITLIASKAEYLNSHAGPGDWIIDDKRLDGLSNGIRALHIQHDERLPADVHSLEKAGEYIRERNRKAIDI